MSKPALVSDLASQRDSFLSLYDSLTDRERCQVRTAEGWTIQDMLGHLSFWEQFTLDCIRDTLKRGRPTPLAPESLSDDLNRHGVASRKKWAWPRIRAEFINTRNALIGRIDGLGEAGLQFYVPSPWPDDIRSITLEAMVREDVLAHGEEHLTAIRSWLDANY